MEGAAVERIFYSILHEPLKMEPLQEAGAPPSLCDLIARCTAKDPAERPQGFAPVLSELDRIVSEMDAPTQMQPAMSATVRSAITPAVPVAATPAPVEVTPAAGRPAWVLPAVLAAIVLLAVGLYFGTRPKGAPEAAGVATKGPVAPPVLARTIDAQGGSMVLVDAGEFLEGKNKVRDTLPAFYIDKTEVSNGEYAKFCAEAKHTPPPDFAVGKPDLPVVNVLVSDARAFAVWAGKRLPKGREWEKAARGKDGYLYPWGNDKDTSRANVGSGRLLPVNSLPSGASPYGALNMSGNVWELVDQVNPPGDVAFDEFTTIFKRLKLAPPTRTEPWYMVRGQGFSAKESLDPSGLWDFSTMPERGFSGTISASAA